MRTTTVNKIVHGSPFPTITCIERQSMLERIYEVNCYLNANAASVQFDLGSGAHGHLALATLSAILDTLSSVPFFINPLTPGQQQTFRKKSRAAQIKSTRIDHIKETDLLIKYDNTDTALKQQLVGDIDPLYFKAICNKYVDFGTQTYLTMFQHLYSNNAKMTTSELLLNDAAMKTDYDANLPIEKIDTAVGFSAAGGSSLHPRKNQKLLFSSFLRLNSSPMIENYGNAEFQQVKHILNLIFFTAAHLELRESHATTLGGDFHANSVTHT